MSMSFNEYHELPLAWSSIMIAGDKSMRQMLLSEGNSVRVCTAWATTQGTEVEPIL